MKKNPFKPNNPVHRDMFAGRIPELDAMDKAMTQTEDGNPMHILLLGERGIGKTSLLNVGEMFARDEFTWEENKHNFLTTRIILNEDITLADFALNLKQAIERSLAKEHPAMSRIKESWNFVNKFEVGGVSYHQEESSKNAAQIVQDFIYSVSDTVKSLRDPLLPTTDKKDGIVILVDEADRASRGLKFGAFLKSLTEILGAERTNHVLFIVSGLPEAKEILRSGHESSLRLFEEHNLSPLSEIETGEVINNGLTEAMKKSGIKTTVTTEALHSMYVFSEGYPHFVQQIGHSAFDADNDDVIDQKDVDRAIFMPGGAMDLVGQRYYAKIFYQDIQVDSQREILTIMADKRNQWTTRKEIEKRFSGGETALNNGLRSLKEKGTIIPREGAKGQYRLQWGSFALWIKYHRRTERQRGVSEGDAFID